MENQTASRLVAIVVTHNRLSQLKTTLKRLLESPAQHLHKIVVFNNASTDGTGSWLDHQTDPRLCALHNTRNIGGAGGFEAAMRHAVAHFDPDWLLLIDDDGHPDPDTIATFHQGSWSNFDAVAGAVYTPDGLICDLNRPSRNPFWNKRAFFKTLFGGGREGFHLAAQDFASDQTQDIDGASFVGLFVSRHAIEIAGYPRGDLFIYGEDVLYTLSLRKAGGRIAFAPTLRFKHDQHPPQTCKKTFRPLWKSYYFHRNLLIAYRLAAGPLFWPALLIVLPRWALKVFNHPDHRLTFLRLLWHAVQDGIAGNLDRPHDTIVAMSDDRPTA
ncbi:MAG: glycosyltransferase [Pseudopelagicola sp.]|nr:glycosyltransferase [Pseudopelagicola sp.]